MQRRFIVCLTGHGFGHAARCKELLSAILDQEPSSRFVLIGNFPTWIFSDLRDAIDDHLPESLDVGAVERDILTIAEEATMAELRRFLDTADHLMESILQRIRLSNFHALIADIPPLASQLAHRLHCPSFAVSNFTWDYIYSNFAESSADSKLIHTIASWRREFDFFLRLPFHHDLDGQKKCIDVPLIARAPSSKREETRESLGLRRDHLVLLVALRGASIRIPVESDNRDLKVLTFGEAEGPNTVRLASNDSTRFSDLLAACDAVLTKPGYGIVSECIATRKPMLLLPRCGFAETRDILATLSSQIPNTTLSWSLGNSLRLDRPLETLFKLPMPERPRVDGAAVAAEYILRHC